MTDAALIRAFRAGNAHAFNTLARLWHTRIYNFVMRYVGDRDEADDLTQATFVRVYERLGDLADPEKFSSWIYRIALNACRDAGRRRTRWQRVDVDEPAIASELSVDRAEFPDAAAHGRSVSDLLNRALQSIPEDERVVVIMKEYEGLKLREIAEAIDVPINTVKTRVYRGLMHLKQTFDRWELSEEMLRYDL